MSKLKVLVLDAVREDAITDLKDKFDVTIATGPENDRKWVLDHIAPYDAVITSKMKFNPEMIDAAKNLKIISTYGVGFDHVDTAYAKKKGIVVSNSPKSVRRPTAELGLTLILACARRICYYDHTIREGKFISSNDYANQGYDIEGKTLAIFGMGRIGKLLASFAKMLGMKIIYHNRHQVAPKIEEKLGAKYVDFDTLIKQADYLSLNAPATPQTTGIISAKVFKKMKKTAFLINIARGALVDEDVLIAALENKEIAGAGLDVFVNQKKVDPKFYDLDNVILTPHMGSATHAGRYNLAKESAENVISYLSDGKAINQVN